MGFDELSVVAFGPLRLIRAARLFYESGRTEMVFVPLLYALTWAIGNDYDRAARMTRFVAHLDAKEILPSLASGVGVGQQDLAIRNEAGDASMFGIGSVSEIAFPRV